jgi:hypothetical protein
MGGGDGVIISRDDVAATLKKPEVLAKVPVALRDSVIRITSKDTSTWTDADVELTATALGRAMRSS